MKQNLLLLIILLSLCLSSCKKNEIQDKNGTNDANTINENKENDTTDIDSNILSIIKNKYNSTYGNNQNINNVVISKKYSYSDDYLVVLVNDYNKKDDNGYCEKIDKTCFKYNSSISGTYIYNDNIYSMKDAYEAKLISKLQLFEISIINNEYDQISNNINFDSIINNYMVNEINIIKGLFSSIMMRITDSSEINDLVSILNVSYIDLKPNYDDCYTYYFDILNEDRNNVYTLSLTNEEKHLTIFATIFSTRYIILEVNDCIYISSTTLNVDSISLIDSIYLNK